MIFSEMLNTQNIILSKKTVGDDGERIGSIQSENYAAGSTGFKIGYDGNAEFNNGTFRGHIEAESGSFKGRIEADSGVIQDVTAINLITQGLTVMEKLTVDQDVQLTNINNIPTDQFARIQQADSPSSLDYPVGSILLAHAYPIPTLNEASSNVWIYAPENRYYWNITGTYKLPGTWRNSGRETGNGNTILIRRVS